MSKLDSTAEKIYSKRFSKNPLFLKRDKQRMLDDLCPFLNFLDSGDARLVYVDDSEEYVVKFAHGKCNVRGKDVEKGIDQNKKEVEIYKRASEEQKKYLADILDYDGKEYKWLKMRYHKNIKGEGEINTSRTKRELREIGIHFPDYVAENAAVRGDQIILIDYGFEGTRLME